MKYLLWDVDGTLIVTGGAGLTAMVNVIKDYYFLDAFSFDRSLAGRTDSDIIKSTIIRLRGRFVAPEAAGLLIRYHMELPKQLPLHKGRIMKNVEKTLEYFQRPDSKYLNCLLTGNTRLGAKLKLQHYKLDQYFDFNHSVFGELAEERTELAKIAWQRLYFANQTIKPTDLIFIGDTPNDVRCAKAIGAPCIIVLEGSSYKKEDFAGCMPWKFLDQLPDEPQELEKLLDMLR